MQNVTRTLAAAFAAILLSLVAVPGVAVADELPPCSATESTECTTDNTNTVPGPFLPAPGADCSGAIAAMQDVMRLSMESDAAWSAELDAADQKVARLQAKVAELRTKLRQARRH